jgi:hypothetical protein
MVLTFQDQLNIVKEVAALTDTASVAKFSRDINTGGSMFIAKLNRDYNRKSRTTDVKNTIQYYQFPVDLIRVGEVVINIGGNGNVPGGWNPPLIQIANETEWNYMNMMNLTGLPTHFFIRGFNEIGLYPIPSYDQTAGLRITFEPELLRVSALDFTIGQITVTNNNISIIHSANGFTSSMVGRWMEIQDDSDYNSYQIASFVDSAHMNLQNFYQGQSGTRPFRIGQVMDMPHEYLEAPSDYALYRHFTRRGNPKAPGFLNSFKEALRDAQEEYGQMSESQVVNAEFEDRRAFNAFRGDSPFSIVG